MSKLFNLIVIFSFFSPVYSAEKTTHLQYQPNQPVIFQSELHINSEQNLPGLDLKTVGKQKLEAILSLSTIDPSAMPISSAPFDVTFTLKSLLIDLIANDEKIYFDTNEKNSNTSLYLSQVSKIIDRPIKIRVETGDNFSISSIDLEQIIYELPVLNDVNPENLLKDIISHIFVLAGEELKIGKKFQKKISEIYAIPDFLNYEISQIDDYHVFGKMSGKIDDKNFQLSKQVPINEKEKVAPVVELSGTLDGDIKWNRDNALLFDLNINFNYDANIKLGDLAWKMNISLNVSGHSSLYNL